MGQKGGLLQPSFPLPNHILMHYFILLIFEQKIQLLKLKKLTILKGSRALENILNQEMVL